MKKLPFLFLALGMGLLFYSITSAATCTGVFFGGTGDCYPNTLPANVLIATGNSSSSPWVGTTTPTVGWIIATSTTNPSIFSGGILSTASSTFTSVLTSATTTAWSLQDAVFVDGVHYPFTSAGVIAAVKTCKSDPNGCGTIFFPAATIVMNNPIDLTGYSNLTFQCAARKTIFQIATTSINNFGFSYMFQAQGAGGDTDIQIRDCNLDGNYQNMVSPSANAGGGINPATRWTVYNNYIHDFNYFPTFVNYATSTEILYNEFGGPGRGNDEVGGGHSYYTEVAYNTYDANEAGNVFDNVNGQDFAVHNNWILSNHNMYIEGMQYGSVYENHFIGSGGISVQSDAGYHGATISNSNNVAVHDNFLLGGGSIANIVASSSTIPYANFLQYGGAISIDHNTISTSTQWSILVMSDDSSSTQWGFGLEVNNNIITDPNAENDTGTINTGLGIVHVSGINIGQAHVVTVSGNVINDDRPTHFMRYGIEIGQTFQPSVTDNEPNHVTLTGNRISGYVLNDINLVSAANTPDYVQWSDSTSTLSGSGGINITTGCFAVNNVCVGGSSLATPISIANGGTATTTQVTNGVNYFDGTHISSGTFFNTDGTSILRVGTTTATNAAVWIDSFPGATDASALHVGDQFTNTGTTKLLVEERWTGCGESSLLVRRNLTTPFFNVEGCDQVDIATTTGYARFTIFGKGTGTSVMENLVNTASTSVMNVLDNGTTYILGSVGIATTSPGSLLSLNGISNFTAATSSFYSTGGINLTGGCFAIATNCLALSNLPGQISLTSQVSGTLGVANGGTGQSSFGQGWLSSDGTTISASTSPTVNYITATSSTATSTFPQLGVGTATGLGQVTIKDTSSMRALDIPMTGARGNSNHGVNISDSSSAGQNAMVNLSDSNTSNQWSTLNISSVRTGQALDVAQNSTGIGERITQTETGAGGVNPTLKVIRVASTTSAGATGLNVAISNTATQGTPGTIYSAIFNGGNFGIGTSSPFAAFSLAGASAGSVPLLAVSSSTASATSSVFIVDQNGLVGVASSTPGSLLSLGGIANFTPATTTFYSTGGIVLTGGCITYTIGGACIGGSGGSGTVTSVALGTPNSTLSLSGTNPVTTSGTINADLNLAHSNWWTGTQNFTNASTSQFTATSSVWFTGTTNAVLGTDNNGLLVATTSIGVNYLKGILPIANGGTATSTQVTNGINFYDGSKITSGTAITFDGTRLGVGTSSPDSLVSLVGQVGLAILHVGQLGNIGGDRLLIDNGWSGNDNFAIKIEHDPSTFRFGVTGAGNVAIGTSTPGSLLSIQGIANFTTATSTIYSTGGINIAGGCFAIGGNCLTQNGGTVASVATNNGISGGTITTSGTLSLDQTFGAVWTPASTTFTQHISLNTSSSTQFSSATIWDSTVGNALWLGDASGKATAYVGSNPCSNQVALSISGIGVISCTSVTDAMFSGQLALSHGGTNASLSGANQLTFINSGNTALTNSSNLQFLAGQGTALIGTSTASYGSEVIGTSTAPQILLADNGNDNQWAFRNAGGLLEIATSTATATSSTAWLTINANGTSTIENGINITSGCFSVNGTCVSGGGGSGTVTSVATNNGITGGTITTTGTLSLDTTYGAVWTPASTTYTQHLSLNTSSSTQFSSATIWDSTVGNALWLGDANGKATAYGGASACASQFVTALSAIGGTTCASVTDGTFSGQLGIAHGGTNASLSGANQILYMNNANTAVANTSLFQYQAGTGIGLIGTSTAQYGVLTIGSSTAPQILLSDNAAGSNMWTLRSISNNFYLATSTATATSSSPVLSIVNSLSTFFTNLLIKVTSATAFVVQDGFGTAVLTVNTASSSGAIFTVQATSSTDTLFSVDQNGHLTASSTRATPTVSSCGTNPVVTVGSTDSVGSVTTGTASPTSCTITFGSAFTSSPVVMIDDASTAVTADVSAISTTAFTVTLSAGLTSTKIYWIAIQGPSGL